MSVKAAETRKSQPAARLEQSSSTLTREDLNTLKAPFARESMGVKVQTFNKERTRAMLVLYLQHTDVQDRLEEVDPAWTCEVVGEERSGDTVYVRTRLTIKGVSRENVGEGNDPKSAYSDALKRSAMLFGVGRYLYDSPTVWTEYSDKDKFKSWSMDDYEAALKSVPGLRTQVAKSQPPSQQQPQAQPAAAKPAAKGSAGRGRDQLNRVLMSLYRPYLSKFPDTKFVELLKARYNVGETRLMAIEQIEDLVQFMEQQLRSVA